MGLFGNPKFIYGFHIEGDPEGLKVLRHMTENEVKTLIKESHEHKVAYFQGKVIGSMTLRHFEIAHMEESHNSFAGEIDRYLVAETKQHQHTMSSGF